MAQKLILQTSTRNDVRLSLHCLRDEQEAESRFVDALLRRRGVPLLRRFRSCKALAARAPNDVDAIEMDEVWWPFTLRDARPGVNRVALSSADAR